LYICIVWSKSPLAKQLYYPAINPPGHWPLSRPYYAAGISLAPKYFEHVALPPNKKTGSLEPA